MWYCGIDLRKRTVALHTLDADGAVVRQANVPARREVLTAYLATLPGAPPARRRMYREVVLGARLPSRPGD